MHTISLCMIVRDEECVLDRCLVSVKDVVDEIIIVDTGSKDNTKNIAKKYTENVYDYTWIDDFSSARNYSFSLANCEYIMWLDADDIVTQNTAKYIIDLKEKMTSDTYMLRYTVADNFSFFRERIVRNCAHAKWQGMVHECITPFGKIEKIEHEILHKKCKINDPKRNLKIYRKIKKEREFTSRELYYYARELYDNKYYKTSIKYFKKAIKNGDVWIENIIESYYMIAECFLNIGDINSARYYLLSSMLKYPPRLNIIAKIADCYYYESNYILSIQWYLLSLNCIELSKDNNNMIKNIDLKYILTQLSLCHYHLKNTTKAIYYNELLLEKYPNDNTGIYNRNYYNSLIKNS